MGNGSAIFDCLNRQARGLKRGNRTFTTTAGPLHFDIYFLHAKLDRFFGHLLGRHLAGERRALSASLEAARASTGPTKCIAFCIGDCHRCVVERRINVSDTVHYIAAHFLFLARCFCFCHGLCILENMFLVVGRNLERAMTGFIADAVGYNSLRYRRSFTPFFPATVFLGPLRVRAFVRVR